MNKAPKPGRRSFQATLEKGGSRLNWVVVRIPFDAAGVWGKRGQLKVKGQINGFAFRTSLFPDGRGGHFLLVNKRMQAGAGVGFGMVAQFEMEPDTEKRRIPVPAELERIVSGERNLRRWFQQLTESRRNEIARWISDVKSAEARQRRANQIAERLLATMEAELDLPPMVRLAFARDPEAREGWERMPPSHRRAHLFGIFYYRDPKAQARRLAKMVDAARQYAEKAKSRNAQRSV